MLTCHSHTNLYLVCLIRTLQIFFHNSKRSSLKTFYLGVNEAAYKISFYPLRNAMATHTDFSVRGVARAFRTRKSDTSDDTSYFLGRGSDGHLFRLAGKKTRPRKSERMSIHMPSNFLGRGF